MNRRRRAKESKTAKNNRAIDRFNAQANRPTRQNLLKALSVFADVDLPPSGSGEAVWFYVGTEDEGGHNPAHLSIDDFKRAQRLVHP